MKKVLLEQFRETFQIANWFVPLTHSIEGLSAEDASLKINEENNSIGEILFHLIYWNDLYLQRFRNDNFQFSEIENDVTFRNTDHLNWEQTVDKVKLIFNEWERVLTSCNEDKLHAEVSKKGIPWYSVIGSLITHNAYHIGQIVAIRKFNNCWDEENGVN